MSFLLESILRHHFLRNRWHKAALRLACSTGACLDVVWEAQKSTFWMFAACGSVAQNWIHLWTPVKFNILKHDGWKTRTSFWNGKPWGCRMKCDSVFFFFLKFFRSGSCGRIQHSALRRGHGWLEWWHGLQHQNCRRPSDLLSMDVGTVGKPNSSQSGGTSCDQQLFYWSSVGKLSSVRGRDGNRVILFDKTARVTCNWKSINKGILVRDFSTFMQFMLPWCVESRHFWARGSFLSVMPPIRTPISTVTADGAQTVTTDGVRCLKMEFLLENVLKTYGAGHDEWWHDIDLNMLMLIMMLLVYSL